MKSLKNKLLFAGIVGACVVGMILLMRSFRPAPENPSSKPGLSLKVVSGATPSPTRSQSPYHNTSAETEYVGSDRCIECHSDQHESYELTAHSQALRSTVATGEPQSTEFHHQPSGRWYKIYRDGDKLRHQESIRNSSGEELVLNDHAMDYTMGSGRFSRSYLFKDDQFWLESPVTWYAEKNNWAMSPGFDHPRHQGFQRLAEVGCVICHAGRVEAHENNSFHPDVLEMSIGCESCHGPGGQHVAERESGVILKNKIDFTIVNPSHLDRQLSEAVCASCHLRGDATVLRNEMKLNDFRPGLQLSDVRIDYGLKSPSGKMEVVGHVEQMHQSACYLKSETMTCTTCHNPHSQPSAETRLTFFRNTCLKCHDLDACGLPHTERVQQNALDDCMACHMPKTDTDIPHFAFTHHRIAVHNSVKKESLQSVSRNSGELFPLAETSNLSTAEKDRMLGLAYVEFAQKRPQHYQEYLERARTLLERGSQDGDSQAALARIYWEMGAPFAAEVAQKALQHQNLTSRSRVNALIVLADLSLRAENWSRAVEYSQDLVKLRRHSGYWELLAQSHAGQGETTATIAALEKAVEISPDRVEFRKLLVDFYRRSGNIEKSEQQSKAIEILDSMLSPK